jgi:hypothetical protein
VGELRKIFKGGRSELLTGIARLAILYEDLRLEMKEFQGLHHKVIVLGGTDTDNRGIYFLRRALETLVEFGRGLNTIRRMSEFKTAEPGLTKLDAGFIADADKFLQQNWARLKDLRNEFAGHIQSEGVRFALEHLTNEVGLVTWKPVPDAWTVGIECEFAGVLLAGAISSKLQGGTDVLTELNTALDILAKGFGHAQGAMVALVHAFLWERF